MRDHLPEIRARGAELVVIGNGAQHSAAAFREDMGLDCRLRVDQGQLGGGGVIRPDATHVVGPHLLARRLRPALERSQDARAAWVASGGMYTQRLQIGDPNWKRRSYDGVLADAETKRARLVLAEL